MGCELDGNIPMSKPHSRATNTKRHINLSHFGLSEYRIKNLLGVEVFALSELRRGPATAHRAAWSRRSVTKRGRGGARPTAVFRLQVRDRRASTRFHRGHGLARCARCRASPFRRRLSSSDDTGCFKTSFRQGVTCSDAQAQIGVERQLVAGRHLEQLRRDG